MLSNVRVIGRPKMRRTIDDFGVNLARGLLRAYSQPLDGDVIRTRAEV
jgi:hypothetical protein